MSEDLGALLDRVMAAGEWKSIRIFRCDDGTAFVSFLRGYSTADCDQCTDPATPPSARLRMMLERNDPLLKKRPGKEEFEDLF